jgi:hypothetical protein
MAANLPVPGFIELLQSYERFRLTAQYIFHRATLMHGLVPEIDEAAMRRVHSEWIEAVVGWNGATNKFGDVSHIKMAGFLLWAFNEQENSPVTACRPYREEADAATISPLGLAVNVTALHRNGKLLQAFPTQVLGYMLAASVFANVQRGRNRHHGIRTRVDWSDPPMTRHYLQNLCWFLFEHFPSKETLYMMFKSFDLYGMVLPFDGKAAEG